MDQDQDQEEEEEIDPASLGTSHAAGSREDKARRNAVFAAWLVSTYGRDALSAGTGVLDVAGGNGPLSTALAKRGVRCNLVDPAAPEEMRVAVRDEIKKSHGPLFRIYKRHFNVDDPEPPAERAYSVSARAMCSMVRPRSWRPQRISKSLSRLPHPMLT